MKFAQVLVDEWIAADAENPKPKAYPESILRNSQAGDCLRSLWYSCHGFDPEPMDPSGTWVTGIGTLLHREWQDALRRAFPDAYVQTEVKVGWWLVHREATTTTVDNTQMLTSGHVDATVAEDGWLTAIELKSIGGVGFRSAVGAPSGYGKAPEAKGPRHGAIRQLALNAHMAGADEARLVYLATEGIGQGKGFDGVDRFAAEWAWDALEFIPIAEDELARFAHAATAETLRVPEFEGDIIPNPGKANYPCAYCPFQKQCLKDSR